MATHCSILAWEIPWTEEPGGLRSMGSQRVRYDEVTNTHKIFLPIFLLPFSSSLSLQQVKLNFHEINVHTINMKYFGYLIYTELMASIVSMSVSEDTELIES